jgi:hypothetical protein
MSKEYQIGMDIATLFYGTLAARRRNYEANCFKESYHWCVAHGKELLEASAERTIEALRRAFVDALEEIGLLSEPTEPGSGYSTDLPDKRDSSSETLEAPDFDLDAALVMAAHSLNQTKLAESQVESLVHF